jgi:hypothetical protein
VVVVPGSATTHATASHHEDNEQHQSCYRENGLPVHIEGAFLCALTAPLFHVAPSTNIYNAIHCAEAVR